MLVTNYANVNQEITLAQTGGAGSTDCSIVNPCAVDAGPDITICSGDPTVTIGADPITSDAGATYTWSTGATGTIDLQGGGQDHGQTTVSPTTTTTYIVTTNFNGCKTPW